MHAYIAREKFPWKFICCEIFADFMLFLWNFWGNWSQLKKEARHKAINWVKHFTFDVEENPQKLVGAETYNSIYYLKIHTEKHSSPCLNRLFPLAEHWLKALTAQKLLSDKNNLCGNFQYFPEHVWEIYERFKYMSSNVENVFQHHSFVVTFVSPSDDSE